jgi:hypothetical protein
VGIVDALRSTNGEHPDPVKTLEASAPAIALPKPGREPSRSTNIGSHDIQRMA